MAAPLLYESHLHTPLCHHAVGWPGEYAAVAERRNLRGIIVTCHAPMPGAYNAAVRMQPEEYPAYVELVRAAADQWAGRVDIRLGLESEYVPGYEAWVEKLHQQVPLHYVLGSVHCQMREYLQRYFTGSWFDFQRTYFTHLAEAAETSLFDCLSHPDLVKNLGGAEEWQLPRIWEEILRALDRIATSGTAMELNTSGLHKSCPEMNPGPEILEAMAERGIPVVLGADAHLPQRVGADYEEALRMLADAGFAEVSFFLDRQRQTVPISAAVASLRPFSEN